MKIKEKIQIRFIGIAFVLAASLISIVYFSMVSHFEHQEGEKLKDNVFQSAKSIDDFMFARVNDLNVLSNNPLFSTSSNIAISNYLSRVVEQYPYYDNITFANTEAHILASSSNDLVGLNIIDIEPDIEEEFYKTLKGGDEDVYISDIAEVSQKEINENSPLDVELLSNVNDLDGNVIGVLVGFVNVQFIKDVTYDIDNRTIGNEYAYLVNSNGDVVISANPETVILQPHPDLSLKELKQKLKNEENGYIIYTNAKGKKVITGFADLSEYGTDNIGNWSLISTAPYDEIMIPIYQMLYKELIAFILILVFIVLLTINLSSSLSKPITKLQKAVAKFDLNKKPLELKIETKDEVEDLSKSFNMMSKNIYDSSQERKQIANLLNESKEQLDNIVNNIGDPVFVKDDQSRLLIVNDAFCNMFNLSKPDVLGLTLAEHVTEEERESFLKIDKQVLEDGIENVNEESLAIKGHETRIISTKKTRYVDKNGNKFLIGVIRDITDRKKTEDKILEIQQKLEAAIRIGNIGYWSWDIINDKLEWSDLMYEIYDVSKNTPLKYDTVLSCVHPDDREFHNKLIEQRIKNKDKSPFEYRVLCKDETIKYVMVQMEVIDDELGEAIFFQGTVIDITERKKAETALIESELKYRTLFTTMSEGFNIGEILYDDNGDPCDYVLIETNSAYETQTGIKAQYVVGKKIRDVLPDIEPVWIKTVGNVVKTGKSIRFEDYDIRTQKYYEAFIYKLKDNHFGILFLDITIRKKAEIELEKYRNQLEGLVEKRTHQLEKEKIKAQSADLMKSAFLATMSHELRTPMNSIIGFAGILLKELAGPLNDEQKKQLAMVKKSGEHLLGLINDILDISKIEAGKLKVSLKPFNYVNSLKNTINFLLPQAEAKGLNMVLKINENDITLISDERRVEQILVNLLSNAIKFSKKGTITVKVDVMNNLINTQIIDVGIGISEENLVKLFKPFMQLEEGLSRSHEGTGLGLAICKNLIEKLGGSIDVKSQLGKGSNFTFQLPLEYLK